MVTASQPFGHGSPAITLSVYAYKFVSKDTAAAEAIEAANGLQCQIASIKASGANPVPITRFVLLPFQVVPC